MDDLSVKDAAAAWGISPRRVQKLLAEGRIPGARKHGDVWLIPRGADKPADPRKGRAPVQPPREHLHLLPLRCATLSLSTLYDRPGRAERIAASLAGDENARALFTAELAYLRGDAREAGARARALLAQTPCFDTRLSCLITVANAAMYAGDYAAWEDARDRVAQTEAWSEGEAATRDGCLASVDSALYDRRGYPEWLAIGCFDPLPPDGFPAARHLYAKYCAISRARFSTLPALEPLCSQTRAEGAVGAELYLRLVVAAGCHDGGDSERAAFHIARALDLALPDRLYAPLAEARRNIGAQFDDMLRARDRAAYRAVCALWDRLMPAWTRLYERRMGRALSVELTLRELEAVKYAANKMTNEEIAERMGVSVSTVRSHIASAMRKTGLQSREGFAAYTRLS